MRKYNKIFIILIMFFVFSGCSRNINHTSDVDYLDDATVQNPALSKATQGNQDVSVDYDFHNVSRVVDGDTIDVIIYSEVERVRLIGVDAPESVDPRSEVECFGVEASNKLHELLDGQKVRLELDTTQSNRDKYDRLLRYVYLEDGTFVNEWLLRNGYTERFYNHPPCQFEDLFREARNYAKENEIGLWNECR